MLDMQLDMQESYGEVWVIGERLQGHLTVCIQMPCITKWYNNQAIPAGTSVLRRIHLPNLWTPAVLEGSAKNDVKE